MFKRSLFQQSTRPMYYPEGKRDQGWINCLQDVYSWRSFNIPIYRIYCERWQRKPVHVHLNNASNIHKVDAEIAEFNV